MLGYSTVLYLICVTKKYCKPLQVIISIHVYMYKYMKSITWKIYSNLLSSTSNIYYYKSSNLVPKNVVLQNSVEDL